MIATMVAAFLAAVTEVGPPPAPSFEAVEHAYVPHASAWIREWTCNGRAGSSIAISSPENVPPRQIAVSRVLINGKDVSASGRPKWDSLISGMASIGSISPRCTRNGEEIGVVGFGMDGISKISRRQFFPYP